MASSHRYGADLELRAERAGLGPRVRNRPRYVSAPDLVAGTLPCGLRYQVECKFRAAHPRVITVALDQATTYSPGAVPIAVIRARGGRAIACLDLEAFAAIAGLKPAQLAPQLALPLVPAPAPKRAKR